MVLPVIAEEKDVAVLTVAVIGSGPSGIYAVDALTSGGADRVDVFDRIPTPYGLVRYGVAADHVKIKSVEIALAKVLERPQVRFFGNVDIGKDLTLADLHHHYDAVVMAVGAPGWRRLGVPGEDLDGVVAATEVVEWYSGHPDAALSGLDLTANQVAVIGAGNVAIDIVRFLVKDVAEMATTDIPDPIIAALRGSAVTEVHLIARRGPAEAKFTTKELRELGELDGVGVRVDPADLDLDAASRAVVDEDRLVARNVAVFEEWAQRPATDDPRQIHVHFWRAPTRVIGDGRVSAIELETMQLGDDGRLRGTGELHTLDVQLVIPAIGSFGVPVDGMDFDERAGVIPNDEGRVQRDGVVVPGEYVAGWIKRGPTGIIGTNKRDAADSVESLFADAEAGRLPLATERDPEAVPRLLAERGVESVNYSGWGGIDVAEVELGARQGRDRCKITDRSDMLAAARKVTAG